MAKYGDLICREKAALIFVDSETIPPGVIDFLEGNRYPVFKIEVSKNKELCKALKFEKYPTVRLYRNGILKIQRTGDLAEFEQEFKDFQI